MPQTQDTDDTAQPADHFSPLPASAHLSIAERTEPAITGAIVRPRRAIWPLAPWRSVLLAIAIFLAITCGPAAAEPTWNMADLLIFISLGVFVAAFTPGSN